MTRASMLYTLLLSSLLCLTSAIAPRGASSSVTSPSAPPPPSQDPWYTAPNGFKDATPGTVLKVRSANGLLKTVANSSAAYNVLYRTTDSNYQPTWAVTTLFVPKTPSKGSSSCSSLLSYQIPYDSADVNESPSYTLYGGADPSIATGLGLGWYVSVPDYEGPLASFTAGVQSGHATLDSVRAVLRAGLGLSSDTNYALWGYSGGALASEWAAELQVQYAPEMSFAGFALGGLTPNVTSVEETINGGPFASLLVNGILGLASQDAALSKYLDSQLKTTGTFNATTFLARRTVSTISFAGQNIFDYFVSGAAFLENPVAQARTNRDGIMGYHGVPAFPIFAYKAIADEISVIADTDALVDRYCAIGANILYQRNTAGGHVSESVNGEPRALAFLTAVLGGSYHHAGCTIQNVTVAIDKSSQ